MSLIAQYEQKQNHFFSTYLGGAIIAVLLALGLFFRFVNLDKQAYRPDELLTSFRISGYSSEELWKDLFGGREFTVQDIQKYQHIQPGKSPLHTFGFLLVDDPKQPPLYFIMARLWAELFGDSIRAIRSLSALISLFVIPSLYWLCRELFDSPRVASLAIALISVSPFHVLYAQEAHPYGLLILTAILSNAALLRAMRLKRDRNWALYALTLLCGIYAHNLFAVVIVAHGIYVVSLKNVTTLERASPYLIVSLAALAAFLPWGTLMLFGHPQLQDSTAWITATEGGPLNGLKLWMLVFSSMSIDTGRADILNTPYGLNHSWIHLMRLPVLLLIGYSLYFLHHKSSTRIWLFVFALIGSFVIPLMTSARAQFLSTYYLAILLSVAYLLATRIVSPTASKRRVWQTITVILISGGLASCAISSWAATWWNKGAAYGSPEVAQVINQSTRPLLIATPGGRGLINLFSLSYVLDPKVRIRLIVDSKGLKIPDGFTDVFLINPPEQLRQILETGNYRIEATRVGELWRLAKKP